MTNSVDKSKADIRAKMRTMLHAMTNEQRHAAAVSACGKLTALEEFQNASVIMLYMPLANEIDVTPVAVQCFRLGKTVCVPKVDWDRREMTAAEVNSIDDDVLDCDEHGVRSPKDCRPVLPNTIDLVIVPGLAFDQRGNRLGRGGGYYDRFIKKLRTSTTTVGLVFDTQIVPAVPFKKSDAAVDMVVTDRRVAVARAARSKA
jgi:5-formyltetrahydrofolate cyclo-ligase